MVECGICFEEYQKDDLEQHRQICVERFVLRCSLCDEDYVSKEGLWNHLVLHEEIKASYKLHQCVLCNNQRAYTESTYWKHIHEVHDGFFLRCSDCGENFRSEKLKNDHLCKTMDETGELCSDAHEVLENRLSINYADNDIIASSELPTSRWNCDICGQSFLGPGVLLRHKRTKFSCMKGWQQKCPHCRKLFLRSEYQAHFALCKMKKFSCELCPIKFETSRNLSVHRRVIHRQKGGLNKIKEKAENFAVKSTGSDSSSSSNIGNSDIITVKKENADNNVQQLAEDPSSTSKCLHCVKVCANDFYLRKHFLICHKPTKCNFCGIILEGTSKVRYHKMKQHAHLRNECAKCSKIFYCIKAYKRHSNVCNAVNQSNQSDSSSFKSTGEVIPIDRSDIKVVVVEVEKPSSEPSSIECSHCGKEETNATNLTRHVLTHHEPVACNMCGITLSSLSEAQHHMETIHKESKHKCPHCSVEFSSKVRLQKHVSRCKNEIIPCDLCGKMFKDEIAVTIHKSNFCDAYKRSKDQEQENTGASHCGATDSSTKMEQESAKCPYCSEELSTPEYVIQHVKVAHQLTKCEICGITMIGLSGINYHKIKCHYKTNYECSNCGKKFRLKSSCYAHRFVCEGLKDSQVTDKKSPMASEATLNGSSETQVVSAKTSEQRVENPSNLPYSSSMFHDAKEGQTNSVIIQQAENVELKLEIKAEETMLQHLENKVPN